MKKDSKIIQVAMTVAEAKAILVVADYAVVEKDYFDYTVPKCSRDDYASAEKKLQAAIDLPEENKEPTG